MEIKNIKITIEFYKFESRFYIPASANSFDFLEQISPLKKILLVANRKKINITIEFFIFEKV